jgi:DNA-binding LytR/AlgR family response regulator
MEYVDIRTIIRIEAISNYSKLYFSNGKTLVVAKVLRWFEERLPQAQFLRTHRTHIINRVYIRRIEQKQQLRVELRADEWIAVAGSKRRLLLSQSALRA